MTHFLRHFKDTSTLYLEIVDYPGEWLLDLPMLAQGLSELVAADDWPADGPACRMVCALA